jgi:endonuclease/exonuclease/phosphatase family metal-dependent hydrolase
LLLGLSTR